MTEPGFAGTSTVASRAFKLQCNDGICTHYGAEFACRQHRISLTKFRIAIEYIISCRATSGSISTTRPTSPSQQLFQRAVKKTYFNTCNLSESNDVLNPLHRAAFYLVPRPGKLGNNRGRIERLSRETIKGRRLYSTTDAKGYQDKPC